MVSELVMSIVRDMVSVVVISQLKRHHLHDLVTISGVRRDGSAEEVFGRVTHGQARQVPRIPRESVAVPSARNEILPSCGPGAWPD
jgi:hypothetical protein